MLTKSCTGALPTFQPTPSPQLDTLLATFRSNVFLPSHLISLQKDLLYKKKNHPLLTSDEPATVRLGDEVLQLHPLSHVKDEPNTRASFAKALDLMTESGDFKNLPGFLQGLKTARRSIKDYQLEKAVRRANESGRQSIINDCLRRTESTGLSLGNLRVAREVVWGATLRAIQSDWSQKGVEKAAKYAENVWELMHDPRHGEKMHGMENAKRRPEVLGVLVQLSAARATMSGDKSAVEKYVSLMLSYWERGREEMALEEGDWNDANYKLLMWAPVWHGIKLARKVLGAQSPLGKKLGERMSQDLGPLVEQCQEILSANPPHEGTRRGLNMYERLSQVSL